MSKSSGPEPAARPPLGEAVTGSPGHDSTLELTARALAAGILFGMLFGAANAYLGLRVGMTVSTSIPVAIMTVALVRITGTKAALLETNISQTVGSASTSLATGTIFTIPAVYLWGMVPSFWQVALLALLGGILGVAAMIPLRELLIVRSAHELPYPEGTACAEVLQVTQRRVPGGEWIFRGLALGILVKLALDLGGVVPREIALMLPGLPNAELGLGITPALLAIGYILGHQRAGVLVSGSVLSWLVLIPLISYLGMSFTEPLAPATAEDGLIADMDAWAIWKHYVKYIGAGAVAAAGISMLVVQMPAIVGSFWSVIKGLATDAAARHRSDRDLPGWVVGGGILLVVLAVLAIPLLVGSELSTLQRAVCAGAVGLFGVIFVAVMARIAGIVGTSSQPTSGITIVTLLSVGSLFAALGWTQDYAKVGVLCVGAIVAIAASCSGDMAQDLKTGRLLGATPAYQQLGQLAGVATACWVVAATVLFLGDAYEFGTKDLPAPQATLISTLIQGILNGTLPWTFLLFGVGVAAAAMLAGVNGLAFAIGIYLPLADMLPIFIGGVVRLLVEWRSPRPAKDDSSVDPGMLAASGLVAGEGLAGVAVAALVAGAGVKRAGEAFFSGNSGLIAGLVLITALAYFLARAGWSTRHAAAKTDRSAAE